jgi:hypothetical protein
LRRLNDALLQDWIDELKKTNGRWVQNQGGRLMREMFPPGYREWLQRFHDELKPKFYLEIGVQNGSTLILANEGTTAFGVDPEPYAGPTQGTTIFKMTSDEFFTKVYASGVDMTFVDGMHLFEFALRDVFNAEVISNPEAVILVHDVLPISPETATREFKDGPWTGDVWKIIPVLRELRPDLKMEVVECAPSGLLVLSGLKPGRLDPAEAVERLNTVIPLWRDVDPEAYVKPEDLIVKEPSVLAKS